MGRNKHPEETVRKILDVSTHLFLEHGYENTTIQDIVDALGMSKGAIYHHFKSKEEIMNRICLDFYNEDIWFLEIMEDTSLSGLEKLRRVFAFQLSDPQKLDIDHISVSLMKNPKIMMTFLDATMAEGAQIIAELIAQGNADGSLHVQRPREMAEAVLLLTNIWIGALSSSKEIYLNRVLFLKEMTEQMGLPILDASLLETCERYFDHVVAHP